MKAILLNPVKERTHSPGVLQLYLYLKNNGVEVEYADVNLDAGHCAALKRLLKHHPGDILWLGLPSDFLAHNRTARFVNTVRGWGYTGHISLGGEFPTMYPERYLDMPIDSVVLGRGEPVVAELLRRLDAGQDWRTIPGLAFRNGSGIQRNPNTLLAPSWDQIPENMDLVNFDDTARDIHIQSAGFASCPNRCTWCPDRIAFTAAGYRRVPVAFKPAARVKKEILYGIERTRQWYAEHLPDAEEKAVSIYVHDCDAFSTPELLERNAEIARWVSAELLPNLSDLSLYWFLWGTVRSLLPLSQEHLELLIASHCTILVGIESFSDSQLRRFGKGTTRAQNLAICEKLGLDGTGILMIFLDPWTTAQEMLDNWTGYMSVLRCPKPVDLKQVDKCLELLPGTPMYKRFLPVARRYKQSKVGAIYQYDLLDPNANRLKQILSQFVHYWTSLREAQQKVCEDKQHPLYAAFRARGFSKCTFCEIGWHKQTDQRFKRVFMRILELGVQAEGKWWRAAEELARQEILALKQDLEAHIVEGKTLFEWAMEYQR
ncbi:MAG: cobalamin B12-binding domain-containing protein [Chloroflexi bacterium]|nr:cobalamin B12-binding domain-containing protein [Chloroflexota bacterium]